MSNAALEIEKLAARAAEQAEDEVVRRAYRGIATRARVIGRGLAGKPLSHEQFFEIQGGTITPAASIPNEWAPETVEAALAADLAQTEYENADRLLSDVHRAYMRATGKDNASRRRELGTAVAVATVDRDEVGERLVAARVAHAALVRRDLHKQRVARLAAMDQESERQRKAAAKELRKRLKAGRATLRKIVGAVGS